jgi:hypothetical protein
MKRSEIKEIIWKVGDSGDGLGGWLNGEYPDQFFEVITSDILQAIEKAGMSPPTFLFQDGDLGSKFISKWESEDE